MGRAKSERRRYPRIERKVPLKLAAAGYGLVTTSRNISCVGVYCHVNKYIPPFTRIGVKMILPIANSAKNNCSVECQGVVVRNEDEAKGGFNIAIFFNEINDSQKKKISKYIRQFLPE